MEIEQRMKPRQPFPSKISKPKPIADSTPLFVWFFLGMVFLFTPLYHHPSALDEGMVPRLLTTSLLMILAGIYLVLEKKNREPVASSPLLIAAGLLFLSACISLSAAVNIRQGSYDIAKGGTFVAMMAVSYLLLRRGNPFPALSWMALANALLIGTIAFGQYLVLVLPSENDIIPDGSLLPVIYLVKATLFHKNELSTHLMMLLPLVVWGYFIHKKYKSLFAATAVFLMILIILLRTRAVWLGVTAGMVVVTLLFIGFRNKLQIPARLWKSLIGVWAVVIVAGIIVFTGILKPQENSVAGRLRSIPDFGGRDNIHRIKVYSSTLDMVSEHPWWGVGPGNWQIRIPEYTRGKFSFFEELSWTRPHNDHLWIASERGILGLLIYYALFGIAFLYLFRIAKKGDRQQCIMAVIWAGGLLAYLTVAFFHFPSERIEHQNLLAITLAVLWVQYEKIRPHPAPRFPKWSLIMTILTMGVMALIYSITALGHEKKIRNSIEARNKGDYKAEAELARNAGTWLTSLDPMGFPPEYYVAEGLAKQNRHAEAILFYQQALKQTPNNVHIHNVLGLSGFQVGDYELAKTSLLRVLDALPDNKTALTSLSAVYYKEGNLRRALQTLQNIQGWEQDEALKKNINFLQKALADKNAKE